MLEQDWERTAQHIHLSLDAIQDRLKGTPWQPVSARLIEEGKANSNFILQMADGTEAVMRQLVREPDALAKELAAVRLLAGKIPLAEVLASDLDQGWSLLRRVPGQTLEQLIVEGGGAECSQELGAALAAIHSHIMPAAGFLDGSLAVAEPWESPEAGLFGYIYWLLVQDRVIERGGAERIERVSRAMEEHGDAAASTLGPPVLCHGDFKPSNLFIDDGRLSAVLDWEFIHAGSAVLDLSIFLRHSKQFPPELAQDFVDGYVQAGGIWPGWKAVRLVDFLSLLDFLNRESAGPRLIAGVQRLIDDSLDDVLFNDRF